MSIWKEDLVPYHGGFLVPNPTPCMRMVASSMVVSTPQAFRSRVVFSSPDEVVRPTPKPKRTQAEYQADRRAKRKGRSDHAAFQERVAWAVCRGVGVDDVEKHLGYSVADLRGHLEKQFKPGMKWSNYAAALPFRSPVRKWCIDHIVPKAKFSADDIAGAFAMSNLRPLWWIENMRKSAIRTHLL